MRERDNKAAIKILLQTLELHPELWETRKKTAEILYDEEEYAEAAEMLWSAPEIPSTDVDVAFVIKIISRAQPNRAIRMIYEIVRRNDDKPAKNMAVASALNDIGMYMQAARFYGAALASDPSLIDLAFERQVLWLDDSHRLIDEWQKSDQTAKPPLDVPSQEIPGGTISPSDIPEDIIGLTEVESPQAANLLMASTPVQKRVVTPSTMIPSSNEVKSTAINTPSTPEISTPAPAQAVPTQALQVAAVISASASTNINEELAPTFTKIRKTTGILLTPAISKKPTLKFK
jgi:hypothetical protein